MIFKRLRRDSPHPAARLQIDLDRCLSCGACVAVCPPAVLALRDIHLTVNHESCTACDRCTGVCPVHALALVPLEMIHHENGL